jgi:RNA polymerase sigma-70 factor (ECF subfamily)
MPDHKADLEIIRRVAAKDVAAFKQLYARCGRQVYHFCLRRTKDTALAEEVTNEVFMEVWRQARTFEGRSAASTWLLTIANHRMIDMLRRRRESQLDSEFAAFIEDDADTPEEVSLKVDKSAAIRRCMEQLSAEHREIIDLVYYNEKSITEIAGILDIPENTVKTRMFYARKKLHTLLVAAGVDAKWP